MAGIDGKVFASKAKSGEIADFPDIERGWGVTESTGYIPTMEHFNGFGKRIDLHINELNKIKANSSDIFTKLQSDERYLKKDALPSYTKAELDDFLKNKLDKDQVEDFGDRQSNFKKYLIDLTDCDPDTYYPCVSSFLPIYEKTTFKVFSQLNKKTNKNVPWATNERGFSLCFMLETNGGWWGELPIMRYISLNYAWIKDNQSPILKIDQITQVSKETFYLRGGAKYDIHINREVSIEAYKQPIKIQDTAGTTYVTLAPIKYEAALVPKTTQEQTIQLSTPVGTIIQSASKITPQGYLKCNGASISRVSYQELFGVIGTTFGNDDNNTFKLPDLRGRFIRGFSDGSSIDSGRTFGSTQKDDLKRHTHAFSIIAPGTDDYVKKNYNIKIDNTTNLFAVSRDSKADDNAMVTYKDVRNDKRGDLAYEGNSDEVRVKNIALNFYIKY